MRIRLYIASLLLLGVFNVQAQYTTEVFATNVDGAGTDLRWYVYTPTTGGPPWPAVVYAQGGGYKSGSPIGQIAADCAAAGFITFAAEHRLAPPHTEMTNAGPPGNGQQDPPSAGHPPEQTDDVVRAIRAARADSRCNGKVGVIGASGGGAHMGWALVTGANGDDRPDVMVALSGVFDNDNADILLNASDLDNIENYIDHTIGEGAPFHTAAQASSSYWQTIHSGGLTPALLFNSIRETTPSRSSTT